MSARVEAPTVSAPGRDLYLANQEITDTKGKLSHVFPLQFHALQRGTIALVAAFSDIGWGRMAVVPPSS